MRREQRSEHFQSSCNNRGAGRAAGLVPELVACAGMEEAEEVAEYYREVEEGDEDGGGGGKEFYEFQPLPTLLEDEENVSLADILSLRDNCLTEQDIWAICLECCYSMKDISHAAIFQTLCITPDTLAFNTSGNVCFMEQLSDDPEGAFVPPEFDLTGNTLEAHLYSLGATLKAAIEYVVDSDSQTEFCQDLNLLLDSMQQENPANRPDIESIISQCEEKLNCSSASVCRSLSSIGRRVLSIESVSAVQDGWDSLWKEINKKDNSIKEPSNAKGMPNHIISVNESCLSSSFINHSSTSSREGEFQNGWREVEFKMDKPCSSPNSFGYHLKKNKREKSKLPSFEKFENFDRVKVEDEIAKLSLKRQRRNKDSPVLNHVDKPALSPSPPSGGMVTLKSWPSVPSCLSPNESMDDQELSSERQASQSKHVTFDNSCLPLPSNTNCLSPLGQSKCHSQVSYENLVMALEQENQQMLSMDKSRSLQKYAISDDMDRDFSLLNRTQPKVYETLISPPVYQEDAVSVSRLVNSPELDEDIDGQESDALIDEQQWIPLKDILLNYGKPLQEDELWALCHECLCTLKTYIDFPVILCLESVLFSHNGEVLFVTHGSEESYDAFCVPPEYDRDGDGTGTEKACVYGIAAILWSAAKFNFSANHKLVLPKKLKRFLLQMAKKESEERPSLDEALQISRKYLLQKNLDSKAIWSHLLSIAEQTRPSSEISAPNVSESSSGFIPVATHSKLMAVKGPVPLTDLPAAFTSPATYFKPIVIMQNTDINRNEVASPKSSPKDSINVNDPVIIEDDICVSDIENQMDEDKASQISKSSSSASMTSHNQNSSLTEYPSDRKEKIPSAASSISSNSSTLTSSPIVNNYLLKQDPKTGNLTLVRVHLSIPDHIPSVSLEAEPVSQSIKTHNSPASEPIRNDNVGNRNSEKYDNAEHTLLTSHRTLNGNNQKKMLDNQSVKSLPETAVNGETRKATSTPLQKVIQLLHDEFAFEGYLENGIEDTAMGEYIFALKGLQHATFCSAVCEKFCDLYWEDHLLENLYKIINGKSPPPTRKATIDSSHDNSPAQLLKRIQKKGRKHKKHEKLSTNEQSNIADEDEDKTMATQMFIDQEAKSPQLPSTTDEGTPMINNWTGSETQVAAGTDSRTSFEETDMTDFQTQTSEKDQQPQTSRAPAENEEEFMYRVFSDCNSLCVSPDFTEEHEDANESLLVNQRENMSICPSEVYKCGSGWSSAFYGSELFDPDVQHYVSILGRQKDKCSKSIEAKRLELEQQLMIETKNYRKTIKLYQNLMQKGRRNKGSDVKELLLKLKGHSEEMKSKVQFLELAKKLLQVSHAEQWGVEPRDLPTVANHASQKSLSSSEDDNFLLIYNDRGHSRDNTSKNLQAGTPLGLLAYLYCRNAVLDGYVQQFLYTFRYFCSQEDVLQFLIDRINNTVPREDTDPCCLNAKIYHRSLILLQTWIEDCWNIDISVNPDLLDRLEDLSNSQSLPKDERGEHLVSLLHELTNKKYTISSPGSERKDDTKSLHSLCTKFSEDNISRKSFNWKLSRSNGLHIAHHKDKQYTISAALPRPYYPGVVEDLSYCVKGEELVPYSIHECSVQQISSQLTLLQEEMFQKCHPVHFLNSRALGVKDKSSNVARTFSSEALPSEVSSLFSPTSTHDKYLLQLLRFADNVSTWVAAEIVTCHTSKLQANILTKFLLVAKLCYEQRDFSSAVQILGGLENLIVRQLPAWKNLPSKVSEILEELKAVEVFLKSDSLCLMKGDRFRTLPTIPSAYLLAMHVQQLETGGFTMANGAFKWNKLRNIAKVISQIHAFQEIPYSFAPDQDFQFYLRQRISHFSDADISALAADNNANFHHVNSEKHSRKIQDTLRRMKATFQ